METSAKPSAAAAREARRQHGLSRGKGPDYPDQLPSATSSFKGSIDAKLVGSHDLTTMKGVKARANELQGLLEEALSNEEVLLQELDDVHAGLQDRDETIKSLDQTVSKLRADMNSLKMSSESRYQESARSSKISEQKIADLESKLEARDSNLDNMRDILARSKASAGIALSRAKEASAEREAELMTTVSYLKDQLAFASSRLEAVEISAKEEKRKSESLLRRAEGAAASSKAHARDVRFELEARYQEELEKMNAANTESMGKCEERAAEAVGDLTSKLRNIEAEHRKVVSEARKKSEKAAARERGEAEKRLREFKERAAAESAEAEKRHKWCEERAAKELALAEKRLSLSEERTAVETKAAAEAAEEAKAATSQLAKFRLVLAKVSL